MSIDTLTGLTPSWLNWVQDNLENGKPVEHIATTLFERGYVQASYQFMQMYNLDSPTPRIDLAKNKITLSDKEVQILFSCTKPMVALIDNFLSDEECQALIDYSNEELKQSRVVSPETGLPIEHEARTSDSTGYQRGATPLITTIENRISELINFPVENGEGLQILRYENGGEYRPHYDYFDTANEGSKINMKSGGQRVGTFLMYLCDVEVGGGTDFPLMNFQARPKRGMALYFSNTNVLGEIDKQTMHAGLPTTQGVKYLATKWLRERAYV